ncbi:DEAD/DEAH box helicase [Streptomyces sp. 4N509B]|uniref:DEAD/DEAH box helicase n=1 Tax=Streptomyces sp. 4N509B TaxID=3457413 RepID=UPI003FD1B083
MGDADSRGGDREPERGRGRSRRGDREVLAEGERLRVAARAALEDHERARAAVRRAYDALREPLVRRELRGIPLARLREVTNGQLRLGAVEQAGLDTVGHVAETPPYRLRRIPGVGQHTAHQLTAAAAQITEAVRETVTVALDPDDRAPETTALVVALHRLLTAADGQAQTREGAGLREAREDAERIDRVLGTLLAASAPARGRVRRLFLGRRRREQVREAVEGVHELLADAERREARLRLAQLSTDLLRPDADAVAAWVDFESRSPEYHTLLTDVAEVGALDRSAAEGFLPETLTGQVRAQPLDDSRLRVSLRGYQAFGARFVLTRRRVILGDEMGLGKTVQAIAVLAHLAAGGATHFLVVCPASVLINWLRETETRSALAAHRLHGPEREAAVTEWREHGGVAVTTFDGLQSLDVARLPELGALVVDEAHYVKNPAARRSRAVAALTERVERVLFVTGTPMENHVDEFRSLVRYLRPELAPRVQGSDAVAGARAFRRAVAPVYLRRNQEDVLTELPGVVHVDEWEEFSEADLAAYRAAVAEGNFMAMRRAAYASPAGSAKLHRLRELVAEAAENGRKVVVFSYFRQVLATVGEALRGDALARRTPEGRALEGRALEGEVPGGDGVFGPIAGDLTATRRQQVVDEFAAASGHAVLLSQIQAGGVGLNIQAASVVVLCEPQVKPTMESQAVGRVHRMGQVRRVQVHRLLATDSVDERMLRLLGRKERLFDAFARRSDVAESTPEAVDVSEQSLARLIVAEERERLAAGAGGHEPAHRNAEERQPAPEA